VFEALILGLVQGLTEFLPISSSAHLSIVPRLLGFEQPSLAFDVLLHFGTLTAVVAYFWRDLWAFVLCLVAPGRLGPAQAALRRRLLLLLVIASVPAAVVGFLLQDWADAQTEQPLRASIWLVITTALMIGAELYDRRRRVKVAVPAGQGGRGGRHLSGRAGAVAEVDADPADRAPVESAGREVLAERELERLPRAKALGIGCAQALALVPGTSRSGATISTGLLLGVSREVAARFSFLLAIPAVLGAGVLKLGDLAEGGSTGGELAIGFAASAISGFLAVSWLIRLLRTHTLWPFIWYRLVAGALFIVLLSTVRA
jgi:undecaprenyl-diphosphatase